MSCSFGGIAWRHWLRDRPVEPPEREFDQLSLTDFPYPLDLSFLNDIEARRHPRQKPVPHHLHGFGHVERLGLRICEPRHESQLGIILFKEQRSGLRVGQRWLKVMPMQQHDIGVRINLQGALGKSLSQAVGQTGFNPVGKGAGQNVRAVRLLPNFEIGKPGHV